MKVKRHKLLERQLKSISSIASRLTGTDVEELDRFLNEVSEAYFNFDNDRQLIEHSMELSSKELFDANKEMREQNLRLQEIQKTAEKLRYERELILNSVGEGIYRIDSQGITSFINPAASQMIGYDASEVIGKNHHNLVHHTKMDGTPYRAQDCPIYSALLDGSIHHVDTEVFWKKDGTSFPIEYTSTPIYEGSEIVGAVVVFKDITRRRQIESELRDAAHQAGMAEIATGVLHNVGNVLNGVNISAEVILRISSVPELETFKLANKLLCDNQSNLAEFFSKDSKGRNLPDLYKNIEEVLSLDFKTLKAESVDLLKKIQVIKEVINLQQNNIKGVEFKEEVRLVDVVENILQMHFTSFARHNIRIVKNFSQVPAILMQKAKLVHVFINLIKNAKEAMAGSENTEKILTIEIGSDDHKGSFITITDNGIGVASENLNRIFSHGFTTKEGGHGFGLHFCANAVAEMGGQILVNSSGIGKGTTFTVKFMNVNKGVSNAS